MFRNEDFAESNIHPPNIFDSPVAHHFPRHSFGHQSQTQLIAHEKTVSNDGRAPSNHSNHNFDEFPFRRKRLQDISNIFPATSLVRLDSNGPPQSEDGTTYSPKINPIYSSANKSRENLRERLHDSSSDEDFDGCDSCHELDDFEHHNLLNSTQIQLYDYDSDYAEDERMMQKWQARRLGLVYLGKEELEKHAQNCQLSEEDKIHYLLGK
eukprot:gene14163-15660_t